ncbi:gliding motility-associated C-terminal domain-containing protein [Flavobacterium plurextorum]|uniref:gliding motility-associated C-terminal domain-containing protein n=1 Tax=Flavobacterium TaxID=237 RepID=UPI00214D3D68|nr:MULTISPECIES: gliding motility-associated C-terminal domain-containing protein [Flavobacterium]UUW08484.1 gliding motility-associated C-terminal domain-containing protein [Flavobacterium plurextorum]
MTKFILKIVTATLFFTIGKLSAQTTNIGEIAILPGTELATVADFDNKSTGDFINDGQFTVYSNYNNDGLVTFSPKEASGLTYFKGFTGAQVISGKELSEFNNVRFDNRMIQPAFLLSTEISIYGFSDFSKGIVSNATSGGIVLFEANAIHKNTNDESYVDGYVECIGKNEFQFPIGDGGYFRPSAFGQSSVSKDFFKSRYVLENSNQLHPHTQKEDLITLINAKEYWKVESNQAAIDLALTLKSNSSTTPSELTNEDPGYSLAIVSWDESQSKWVHYASAVDNQNETITAAINKTGIFTLAKIKTITQNDIVVYNAISPNGDGLNDYFNIEGLENFSENSLQIFNRYGVKVFETVNYGANGNWFRGISDGRTTVAKNDGLPTGTYFYVIKYKTYNGDYKDKAGYLYINND